MQQPRSSQGRPPIRILCLLLTAGVAISSACRQPEPSAPQGTERPEAPASARPSAQPPVRQPEPAPAASGALPADQAALLSAWYEAVGARRPRESFGELVVRAGAKLLGRPYDNPPQTDEPERLEIQLATLQCVSFVESSLSLARCIWMGERDATCFARELEAYRYRGGKRTGFASRLHYFVDWMEDNAGRGRLRLLGGELGGRSVRQAFTFMTSHRGRYPRLVHPAVFEAVRATEQRLSGVTHFVIPRGRILEAQRRLRSGDVLALVSSRHAGMMISHSGLVLRGGDGKPRLLHASHHHGRVLLMSADLATYVTQQPERIGIMVARPVAPR